MAVQVWDTGIGIADEHLALIFQEFYQVDNPERDRRLGLGLGLSIVKRLCALLGHTLHVRSVPGRGSMFEIMLPSAAATESVITSDAAPSEQRNILSGAVVLVIDDELEVRESCSLLLESWGCFAIAADSAHDAIARIQGGWRFPDLIIADFRLRANATGADAIRRVRDDCGLEIPGILITGDTAPERIREARASGFRLYHKPLAAAQLNAALMCALTGAACSDLS